MIYLVEDDINIRKLMEYTLNSAGFNCMGFNSGEELFKKLNDSLPRLILLDLMLPGEDGFSILKKLKSNSKTQNIPIIIASAKGTEYDKVVGLDLGADDYLVKPFGMMEMIARVKALLRRSRNDSTSIIRLGELELDKNAHQVKINNEKIGLTLKEYKLLVALLEHPNRVYTRENLLSIAWDEEGYYETRTVDVHIGTLRNKIGEYGNLIKTVRGVGYRLEE